MKTESMPQMWRRSPDPVVIGLRDACFGIAHVVGLCVMIVAAGCGHGSPPTGAVRGKVTIRGEHLDAGQVCVASRAGIGAVAAVAPDGTYDFKDRLPLGEYTVWLAPPPQPPPPLPPTPGQRPPAVAFADHSGWIRRVPAKYRSEAASPLRLTVEPGDNVLPLEIAE